jgi:nucleotide-binding universal stress UspA family protein
MSDRTMTVRGVLHPTDFSPVSDSAFRLACGLAQDYQAPLYILHVATAFEAFKGELVFKERSAPYLGVDWERLNEYRCPGVEIHRLLIEGDPAEQILRASHAIPCDFIVMGSHGRSGLPRLLLGSVAESVLRNATCQVIIVKAPSAAIAEK